MGVFYHDNTYYASGAERGDEQIVIAKEDAVARLHPDKKTLEEQIRIAREHEKKELKKLLLNDAIKYYSWVILFYTLYTAAHLTDNSVLFSVSLIFACAFSICFIIKSLGGRKSDVPPFLCFMRFLCAVLLSLGGTVYIFLSANYHAQQESAVFFAKLPDFLI